MQQFDILDGEYTCFIDRHSHDVFVAHINHVHRTKEGVILSVQVALVSAHFDLGSDDAFLNHWRVNLFIDSNVRYDSRDATTTIVANPEVQAGDNQEQLERLISLRDSDLPYCHPDLPRAIGAALIEHCFCLEPVAILVHYTVHHSMDDDSVITFGEVYDDD